MHAESVLSYSVPYKDNTKPLKAYLKPTMLYRNLVTFTTLSVVNTLNVISSPDRRCSYACMSKPVLTHSHACLHACHVRLKLKGFLTDGVLLHHSVNFTALWVINTFSERNVITRPSVFYMHACQVPYSHRICRARTISSGSLVQLFTI